MKKVLALLMTAAMLLSITAGIDLSALAANAGDEAKPVSIAFTLADNELIENVDGAYDEYSGFFRYRTFSPYKTNNQLTLSYSDGTSREYTYYYGYIDDTWYNGFYDEDGNCLNNGDYSLNTSNQQYEAWELGEHTVKVNCYDYVNDVSLSTEVTVNVVENPVKSIDYQLDKTEYMELVDGYENMYGSDSWFYYYVTSAREGNQLTVNYKDGSSKTYTYQYYSPNGYYDENGDLLKRYDEVSLNDDQSYENQWGVGTHEITVSYMGKTTQVPIEIIANPVAGISYSLAKSELQEYTNGYYSTYTENGETKEYFVYDVNQARKGDVLTVEYTDGTVKNYTYDYGNFVDEDGNYMEGSYPSFRNDQQSRQPWALGEHMITVNYMGRKTQVPLTLVESRVASIDFEFADNTMIEGCDGYTDYDFSHDVSYYKYNLYDYMNGNRLTVNYKNGKTEEYVYSDDNYPYGFFNVENGEQLEGSISITTDQSSENQWKSGDHTAVIRYGGAHVEKTVTVIPNPVASISFTYAHSQLMENRDGYYTYTSDEDGNEVVYFCYEDSIYKDGNTLTVNYTDGHSTDYTYSTIYDEYGSGTGRFRDEDGNVLPRSVHAEYEEQYYGHEWKPGVHNATVTYLGATTEASLEVIENPIASISFSFVDNKIIENADGETEWDYNDNEYFNYDIPVWQEGNELTVRSKNGSSTTYTYRYSEEDDDTDYYDGQGNRLEYELHYSTDQYRTPWGIGEHTVTLQYGGFTTQATVEVVENPVESIDVHLENDTFTEGVDGTLTWDWNQDNERVYYTRYNIPFWSRGTSITVHYKNGTSTTYTYNYSDGDGFYDEGGNRLSDHLSYSDPQNSENQWGIGTHYFTVKYLGVTAQVPIHIIENPVASIDFEMTNNSVIESMDGYERWEELDDGEEVGYFCYNFHLYERGNKLTVNYKDGTSETYVYRHDPHNGYGFYNEQGEEPEGEIEYDTDQSYENQWGRGDHSITVSYMGVQTEVPVRVIANPVTGIAFSMKNNELEQYTHGYYRYDEDGNQYFYYTIPLISEGNTLTVYYSDKDPVTYTYRYDSDEEGYYFSDAQGNPLPFSLDYDTDQSYANQWGLGSHNVTVACAGQETTVFVTVKENSYSGISFRYGAPFLENIDGYYDDEDGDGAFRYSYGAYRSGNSITLYKKDGTSETYTCEFDGDMAEFRTADGKRLESGIRITDPLNGKWELGDHTVSVTCLGFTVNATASVVKPDYPLNVNGGVITEDEIKNVSVRKGQIYSYSFTPTADGEYDFSSFGNLDTYGYIYQGDTEIDHNDDNEYDSNFQIIANLKAGTTYTLKCRLYSSSREGDFSIKISRTSTSVYKAKKVVVTVNGAASENTAYSFVDNKSAYVFQYYGKGNVTGWEISGGSYRPLAVGDNMITVELLESVDTLTVNAVVSSVPDHTHSYTDTVIPPTCTENGYTLHRCSCGDSYTDNVTDALGHDWNDAVFTWNGYDSATAERTCKRDSAHKETKNAVITSVTKEATATENGLITYTAKVEFDNGDKAEATKTKDIPATGYTYRFSHFEWAEDGKSAVAIEVANENEAVTVRHEASVSHSVKTEPSCTAKGVTLYTAEYDGNTDTKEIADIPTIDHNYKSVSTVNPTCTERGYTVFECTICHEATYNGNYTNALGHNWGAWTTVTPATCTAKGTEKRSCTRCTTAEETREVNALGHSWGPWVSDNNATYDQDGTKSHTCSRCGYKETVADPGSKRVRPQPAVPAQNRGAVPSAAELNTASVNAGINIDATSIVTISNKKKMTIRWNAVQNISNYQIQYRKAGAAAWNEAFTSGAESYVLTGLKSNGLYEFRLRALAITSGGWAVSDWSNVNYRYIYKVTAKKVKAGKKSLTVQWAKDKKATGYQVMVSTDKNFKKDVKIINVKKSKSSATVRKLTKGKKYYVRVRALKKSKGITYTGEWSAKKNTKVK